MMVKMTNFKSIQMGILCYPGAQQTTILGLRDLFIMANQSAQATRQQSFPDIQVNMINLEDKIDYTDIAFLKSRHAKKEFSVIIIPPDIMGIPSVTKDDLYWKFLQLHHQKGTIIASVGTGAFLLAQTGLLAHKRVTTHWQYGEALKQFCPEIILLLDQLLVDDTDIITTSGGICWGDLGLRLINRFLGPVVMADVAKMYLLQPSQREQRHYCVFELYIQHGDVDILRVQK